MFKAALVLGLLPSLVWGQSSANYTVVSVYSSLTDASGNVWKITQGQVCRNNLLASYSKDVIEIAYVSGVIWQENTSFEWYPWQGNTWGKGTSTSPLK